MERKEDGTKRNIWRAFLNLDTKLDASDTSRVPIITLWNRAPNTFQIGGKMSPDANTKIPVPLSGLFSPPLTSYHVNSISLSLVSATLPYVQTRRMTPKSIHRSSDLNFLTSRNVRASALHRLTWFVLFWVLVNTEITLKQATTASSLIIA